MECGTPLQVCAMRATLLDSLGNVQAVADNVYVSDKIVEVGVSPEIEPGTSSILKGGCDNVIARYKGRDILLNWTFEMARGALEPALVAMLLNATPIEDGADVIGWANPWLGEEPAYVAFEFWMKNQIDDAQDPDWPWIHFCYPSTSWQFAPQTYGQELQNQTLAGFSRTNLAWGQGPHGDGPGYDIRRGGVWYEDDAYVLPTAGCGYQTVTPGS